jgi:hypothetical protein
VISALSCQVKVKGTNQNQKKKSKAPRKEGLKKKLLQAAALATWSVKTRHKKNNQTSQHRPNGAKLSRRGSVVSTPQHQASSYRKLT